MRHQYDNNCRKCRRPKQLKDCRSDPFNDPLICKIHFTQNIHVASEIIKVHTLFLLHASHFRMRVPKANRITCSVCRKSLKGRISSHVVYHLTKILFYNLNSCVLLGFGEQQG